VDVLRGLKHRSCRLLSKAFLDNFLMSLLKDRFILFCLALEVWQVPSTSMSTLRIQTGGMNVREGGGRSEQGVSLHLFVES
jgi:hypothetical protein